MAYRPPHLRSQPQPQGNGRQQHEISQPSSGTPPQTRDHIHSSQSRPANRNAYPIIHSARDQRPTRRLAEVKLDPMELIQSVSRSGGDGAEGDVLKDFGMQDRYRVYIDERIDKHYATFKTERHTAPGPDRQEELESLSSIVLLFRKLREGVVASSRIDEFAIEVFESSARLAILAKHIPQLNSSLSGLVPGLYRAVHERKGKGRASAVDDLVGSLSDLSVDTRGDNRAEFASILLLLQLVQSEASSSNFHATLLQLTSPLSTRLYPKITSNPPETRQDDPLLSLSTLSFAVDASRALSVERFNPMRYFQLLNVQSVSPYERIVLGWAEERVRERAWEVMKKAYISVKVDWASNWVGREVEAFAKKQGVTCIDGTIKLR